ncbi:Crp/Fnr family transcriptional regulator [Gracilibacillus kekensis]|uniref:cAMP-binding domain of CRP or a regulatory subunit of cAMP-dependent protein kinases n=1 Tax=Gracilibacillus kekensis TaxID=1027249 RepID=A0A1M7L863_9BACI|nr:Crp/Fnr family transcriptional regulator [Gracilibacillus kekensis]SHM73987.1 cAMP-binding domain of CRP or a regulatory subunit of cAMP-dependent protein kinases [Gracilibacillus kekensis]
MNHQAIFKSFSQLTDIPELEWHYLKSKIKWHSVRKGDLLVQAGEVSDRIYFCHSGVFRMFYLKEDGDEFNKSFVQEGQFFTSYSSVISSIPSYFAIQALENAVVASFTYKVLLQLYERHHCWEVVGRKLIEQLYIKKETRERQLLLHSAEERYHLFLEEFPGLEDRITQYHIASYLGISPVSLSRIRGQLSCKSLI